jgi:hypothetical protein
MSDKLPQLGRSTLHTLSFWERLALTGLRVLRLGTVLAALLIGTLLVVPNRVVSPTDSHTFSRFVLDNPWPTLGGLVVLFLVLGSLIRRAEST